MAEIELRPVASSHLRAIGYDAESRTLRIRFHNGVVYDYAGVPGDVAAGLLNAPSKGVYLRKIILPRYKARKV